MQKVIRHYTVRSHPKDITCNHMKKIWKDTFWYAILILRQKHMNLKKKKGRAFSTGTLIPTDEKLMLEVEKGMKKGYAYRFGTVRAATRYLLLNDIWSHIAEVTGCVVSEKMQGATQEWEWEIAYGAHVNSEWAAQNCQFGL